MRGNRRCGVAVLSTCAALSALILAPVAEGQISGVAWNQAFESNNLVQTNTVNLVNGPNEETGVVKSESTGSVGLAKSGSYLGAGGLGASAATSASGKLIALPGGGMAIRPYQSTANGNVSYTDFLTITSATVPEGTPVSVRVCWAVDLVLNSQHTGTGAANYTSASGSLTFRAIVPSPFTGFHDYDTAIRSGNGNPVGTGVWADGTAERTINVVVGTTFQLLISMATSSLSGASNTPALTEALGGSEFCAGLAFGAAALTPGVQVMSSYLGGEFPDTEGCTPLGASQFVPVLPSPSGALTLCGMGALLGIARRRR